MPRPAWRRRRFIVDNLQYRLLVVHVVYFVIGVSIVAAVLFLPLLEQLRRTEVNPLYRREVASQLLILHERFWPALLAAFVLLGLHSVLTSHRISGPLYRFRVLEAVKQGDLSAQVNLRKHDYLMKEAEVINEMIDSLRARVRRLDEQQRQADAALAALLERLDTDTTASLGGELGALRSGIAALREGLDGLVVEPRAKQAGE